MKQADFYSKLYDVLIDNNIPSKKSLKICYGFYEELFGGGKINFNSKMILPSNEKRNKVFYEMKLQGKTFEEIGKKFNVTGPAISYGIKQYKKQIN